MKVETYYDIGCDICARHRSTDFELGMATSKKGLSAIARSEGWIFKDGENVCPICAKEHKEKK